MLAENTSSFFSIVVRAFVDSIASLADMRLISVRFVSSTRMWLHSLGITARTWPVSGVFTPAQAALYQAVLNVQKACILLCTERERMSLHDLHQKSTGLVSQELTALGFKLRYGDVERVLYPHSLTHPVGIGASYSLPSHHIGLCLYDCHQTFMNRNMRGRKRGFTSWF